jgi:hypothetical protein
MHWLPIMQWMGATAGYPLLIAIAYEMAMRRKSRIAITADTWALAGHPRTYDQRRAVIAALKRAPSIVRLEFKQRIGSKYVAHKGMWWDKAPPRADEDRHANESED